jgi:hypothetical protein
VEEEDARRADLERGRQLRTHCVKTRVVSTELYIAWMEDSPCSVRGGVQKRAARGWYT